MAGEFEIPGHAHGRARAALPWYVNGTLPGPERDWLRAHLDVCGVCRCELERERRVAAHVTAEPVVEYAPQAALRRLLRRIEAAEAPERDGALRSARPAHRSRAALTRAIVMQAVAILVLVLGMGWLLLRPQTSPEFRVLSRPVPAPVSVPHLQIVFDDGVTAAEITGVLQSVHGRIVDGPSAAGVFRVVVDGTADRKALESAAQRLARQPGVRFVSAQWLPAQAD